MPITYAHIHSLILFSVCIVYSSGWVTIGPDLSGTTFNPKVYASYFEKEESFLLPFDDRIEELRPKSPPPKAGGRGRGGGGPNIQTAPPPGNVQSKHLVFPR